MPDGARPPVHRPHEETAVRKGAAREPTRPPVGPGVAAEDLPGRGGHVDTRQVVARRAVGHRAVVPAVVGRRVADRMTAGRRVVGHMAVGHEVVAAAAVGRRVVGRMAVDDFPRRRERLRRECPAAAQGLARSRRGGRETLQGAPLRTAPGQAPASLVAPPERATFPSPGRTRFLRGAVDHNADSSARSWKSSSRRKQYAGRLEGTTVASVSRPGLGPVTRDRCGPVQSRVRRAADRRRS
jgi:hypothetical protein